MAALTFFLATSPSKMMLTRDEIEALLLDLLHKQYLLFPAAIFVGNACNEVRGEEWDIAAKEGTLLQASQYIIPNEPESMLRLGKNCIYEKKNSPETLWYYGDDETAFVKALRSIPFRESDICFCFPFLSHALSHDCGWDQGVAFYALTHPFSVDFMDMFDTTALPLMNYPISDFFVASSFCGGGFSNMGKQPTQTYPSTFLWS